jgi:hypothetical protein
MKPDGGARPVPPPAVGPRAHDIRDIHDDRHFGPQIPISFAP